MSTKILTKIKKNIVKTRFFLNFIAFFLLSQLKIIFFTKHNLSKIYEKKFFDYNQSKHFLLRQQAF